MPEVSSSKPLANISKRFAFWVELVVQACLVRVTFFVWFAFVICVVCICDFVCFVILVNCELLHRSNGFHYRMSSG